MCTHVTCPHPCPRHSLYAWPESCCGALRAGASGLACSSSSPRYAHRAWSARCLHDRGAIVRLPHLRPPADLDRYYVEVLRSSISWRRASSPGWSQVEASSHAGGAGRHRRRERVAGDRAPAATVRPERRAPRVRAAAIFGLLPGREALAMPPEKAIVLVAIRSRIRIRSHAYELTRGSAAWVV
jgi:hypothetical protein